MTISEPAVILGVGTAVLPDICHALGLPTGAKVKKPATRSPRPRRLVLLKGNVRQTIKP